MSVGPTASLFRESEPRRLRTRSLPSAPSRKRSRCFFFFSTGRCVFGSLCRFSHERQRYVEKPPPPLPPQKPIHFWPTPTPLFPGELPEVPFQEVRARLDEIHRQLRKEWWQEWKGQVRQRLLAEEKALGVMEATHTAREFVAQMRTLNPHANGQELEDLEHSVEESLQRGEIGKQELEETLAGLRELQQEGEWQKWQEEEEWGEKNIHTDT
jgi:hypothetical protein